MSSRFKRRRRGRVVATFVGFEADLLRSLASQLIELLTLEGATQSAGTNNEVLDPLAQLAELDLDAEVSPPDDPVLQRLLPSAYVDDQEAAADFRRFTESQLRDSKASAAAVVIASLEEAGLPEVIDTQEQADTELEVELDQAAAASWLKSLTDMRLALATRLGIEQDDEDYWESLPEDDPRSHVHAIYSWLGFVQDTLVDAVST